MLTQIVVVLCVIYTVQTKPQSNVSDIETLKKEKENILRQLNEAIDDSVQYLQKNNDTHAIDYITQLRDTLNITQQVPASFRRLANFSQQPISSRTKNKAKKKVKTEELSKKKKPSALRNGQISVFNLFGGKGKKKKEDPEVVINREKVQLEIENWIKQREEEKMKANPNRAKIPKGTFEKCPRFGTKKKSSKKKKGKKRGGGKYPCCRKCCKKSYMGCL